MSYSFNQLDVLQTIECLLMLVFKFYVFCIKFGVKKYPTSTFTVYLANIPGLTVIMIKEILLVIDLLCVIPWETDGFWWHQRYTQELGERCNSKRRCKWEGDGLIKCHCRRCAKPGYISKSNRRQYFQLQISITHLLVRLMREN